MCFSKQIYFALFCFNIHLYTVHPAVQRDKNAQTNNSQNKHVIRSHSTRKDSHPVLHCVAPRAGLSQKMATLSSSAQLMLCDVTHDAHEITLPLFVTSGFP